MQLLNCLVKGLHYWKQLIPYNIYCGSLEWITPTFDAPSTERPTNQPKISSNCSTRPQFSAKRLCKHLLSKRASIWPGTKENAIIEHDFKFFQRIEIVVNLCKFCCATLESMRSRQRKAHGFKIPHGFAISLFYFFDATNFVANENARVKLELNSLSANSTEFC